MSIQNRNTQIPAINLALIFLSSVALVYCYDLLVKFDWGSQYAWKNDEWEDGMTIIFLLVVFVLPLLFALLSATSKLLSGTFPAIKPLTFVSNIINRAYAIYLILVGSLLYWLLLANIPGTIKHHPWEEVWGLGLFIYVPIFFRYLGILILFPIFSKKEFLHFPTTRKSIAAGKKSIPNREQELLPPSNCRKK